MQQPDPFDFARSTSFPIELYESYKSRTNDRACRSIEFGPAYSAILTRYTMSHDGWQEYRGIKTTDNLKDRNRKDKALFDMIIGGHSCIEITCYSLAAQAFHFWPLAIPFGEEANRKEFNLNKLKLWLKNSNECPDLVKVLSKLDTKLDCEWKEWHDIRNRLIHRSNLPVVHTTYTGTKPLGTKDVDYAATGSTQPIKENFDEFDARFMWLTETLRSLLEEGTKMGLKK